MMACSISLIKPVKQGVPRVDSCALSLFPVINYCGIDAPKCARVVSDPHDLVNSYIK